MKSISAALWSEILKVRRSKILWIMGLIFLFIPFMMGLLMFVQKYPEIASKLGMIGTKASMLRIGKADWLTYFGLIIQTIAGIGLIGFGFVTSWIFGREYSDRTAKDMLALPTPRSLIVISKYIVVLIWCIILSLIFLVFGLIIGTSIHLSGWSINMVFYNADKFIATSLFTILLCTPVGFFASYGRGYLLPIGFVVFTMIIAQFSGLVSLGPYFPWAIPGLFSVSGNLNNPQLGAVSYIILFLTCILGLIGTIAWWRFADQY
jgi:ABC-2 type transport system permease protein